MTFLGSWPGSWPGLWPGSWIYWVRGLVRGLLFESVDDNLCRFVAFLGKC
jgi:hypothetical protein